MPLSPLLLLFQSHLQYHNSQRSGSAHAHAQLRSAQSVDHLHLHRAQLEEKDKAIEALKQAAKVRKDV